MAKWWCTEQQCKVTDECLQLFGGYGYMAEYPIARLYADARVQKIYGGTNEIMKDLIARKLRSMTMSYKHIDNRPGVTHHRRLRQRDRPEPGGSDAIYARSSRPCGSMVCCFFASRT